MRPCHSKVPVSVVHQPVASKIEDERVDPATAFHLVIASSAIEPVLAAADELVIALAARQLAVSTAIQEDGKDLGAAVQRSGQAQADCTQKSTCSTQMGQIAGSRSPPQWPIVAPPFSPVLVGTGRNAQTGRAGT